MTADLSAPPIGPMPAEVSARLLDVIAAELTTAPSSGSPAPGTAAPGTPERTPPHVPAGRRDAPSCWRGVGATGRRRSAGGPQRPGWRRPTRCRRARVRPDQRPAGRQRWLRAAVAGSGALVAAAFVVGGLALLNSASSGGSGSAADMDSGGKAAAPAVGDTVAGLAQPGRLRPADLPAGVPLGAAGVTGSDAHDLNNYSGREGELVRLAGDPVALTDCVNAVTSAHPGSAVTSVGFARFEGAPALIVTLVTSGGWAYRGRRSRLWAARSRRRRGRTSPRRADPRSPHRDARHPWGAQGNRCFVR